MMLLSRFVARHWGCRITTLTTLYWPRYLEATERLLGSPWPDKIRQQARQVLSAARLLIMNCIFLSSVLRDLYGEASIIILFDKYCFMLPVCPCCPSQIWYRIAALPREEDCSIVGRCHLLFPNYSLLLPNNVPLWAGLMSITDTWTSQHLLRYSLKRDKLICTC